MKISASAITLLALLPLSNSLVAPQNNAGVVSTRGTSSSSRVACVCAMDRTAFLKQAQATAAAAGIIAFGLNPPSAHALVKGVAPPPKKKVGDGTGKKCSNVEECQEMAERAAAEQEAELRALPPPLVAAKGTRYRDIEVGTNVNDGAKAVKDGDRVSIGYKVLKLGKRSYDGISGEGTVVFSRGYGLEDDEDSKGGDTDFEFDVGNLNIIGALNDGIVGMQEGGIRRISVLPQMGWEKPIKACDGGPGGSGSGGELKTDYVIVPTATMVATETCFDNSKLPFPKSYAESRRMAQRFDQSLLMEIRLNKIL